MKYHTAGSFKSSVRNVSFKFLLLLPVFLFNLIISEQLHWYQGNGAKKAELVAQWCECVTAHIELWRPASASAPLAPWEALRPALSTVQGSQRARH